MANFPAVENVKGGHGRRLAVASVTIAKSKDAKGDITIQGFIQSDIIKSNTRKNGLYIYNICTRKNDDKLGKQLIQSIEQYGKKNRGIKTIELRSIFSSIPIYKKLGFTINDSNNYSSLLNESNNYNNVVDPVKMIKTVRGGTRKLRKLNTRSSL